MPASNATSSDTSARAWYIVSRWQEFQGEMRANLLRILCVLALYSTHLVNHYFLIDAEGREKQFEFHKAITILCSGWVFVALGVQVCLRRQWLPAAMCYVTTGADILLVTLAANLGPGPNSPAVFGYFLVIVLAGLRFQVVLLWCASLGCVFGYLALLALGHPAWFAAAETARTVPRIEEAVVIVSLLLCGIIVGQIVRQAPNMAGEYVERMAVLEDQEKRV